MKSTGFSIILSLVFFNSTLRAQYLEAEIDSVHMGSYMSTLGEVDLTGYVTFSVWAYVPQSIDCVVGIVGGINDNGNDLECGNEDDVDNLVISFNGNVFNEPIGGTLGTQQLCLLFAPNTAAEFDSYLTVGSTCSMDGGSVYTIGLPCDEITFPLMAASGLDDMFQTGTIHIDNGGYFTLPGGFNPNTIAGDDLRVKVAQFTTNAGFCMSGWMSYQPNCTHGSTVQSVWFDICQQLPCETFGEGMSYIITPEDDGDTFSIEITGGSGTISSEIYDLGNVLLSSSGTLHTGIGPGVYNIKVFNNYGCYYAFDEVLLEELQPLSLELAEGNEANCTANIEGEIEAEINGGWPPYSVEVNGIASSQSVKWIAFGLESGGTNTIAVTDAMGSFSEFSFDVIDEDDNILTTTADDVSCYGYNDGEVILNSAWAFESIDWNNGQSGSTINNLDNGIYFFLAVDESGCAVYEGVPVNEFPPLETEVVVTGISCFGEADATALVQISGGTGDYFLSWNGSNPLALGPGTHTYTAFDNNNCTVEGEVVISEPAPLGFSVVQATDETAAGAADGTITIEINGGIAPYEIQWSNGETGPTAVSLTAGSVTFTATDAHGCELSDGFVVETGISEQPLEIILIQYHSQSQQLLVDAGTNGNRKTISVFDSAGRLVLNEEFTSTRHRVPVAFIASGIYTVKVFDENQTAKHQFIRQ